MAGALLISLGPGPFTLAWTHSVEKIAWEEDWQATPQGLVLAESRVRGSGAGMEPPPQARLVRGVWRWRPALPPQRSVILRRSGATADWRICREGDCQPMRALVPDEADPVTLTLCP